MKRLVAGVVVCASAAFVVAGQVSIGPYQVVAPGPPVILVPESVTIVPIDPVSINSQEVSVRGSLATDRGCRKGRRIEFRWDRTGAVVGIAKTSSKGKFSRSLPMPPGISPPPGIAPEAIFSIPLYDRLVADKRKARITKGGKKLVRLLNCLGTASVLPFLVPIQP